jgi:muramoyltetrapeptide carboxypeptidase
MTTSQTRAPLTTVLPPPLVPGARVRLLAPAGPLRGPEELAEAERNVRALGWQPSVGAHALDADGYLAGDDASRLRDLNEALRDPDVDAIWCLRGGYGVMRLLADVDFGALRARPLPIIGYSDITALHHAAASQAGLCGLHGPCARGTLSRFSADALARAAAGQDGCGIAPEGRVLKAGRVQGVLSGGNLALLVSLLGTPYLHVPDGAILVLEDVHEPVYRIDRMLRQLRLAGVLARCAGLVFGAFTERGAPDQAEPDGDTLECVLRETADAVDGPCLAGAPVGHVDEQWSWPLGARAELDAEARRVRIMAASER